MADNLQTTYVRHGNKIKCPKCQSTTVKALKTQPKKYPKPTEDGSNFKLEELMHFYNNGYSCNKCGNHFIAYFESEYPSKKPSMIMQMIKISIKFIIYLSIVLVVISFIMK